MKKLSLCVATALTVGLSTAGLNQASAQEASSYENWLGGFAQYYNADNSKHDPIGGLEDGTGFGLEAGFKFDSSWAIRFELGRIMLDHDSNNPLAMDSDGMQLGADLVYFLKDDAAYLFGGLRDQSLDIDDYRMAALGVGKHWPIDEKWRVISEIATYYDFGQGYNEYSLKLGLAYTFGKNRPVSNPDSDGDGVYDAVDRCPGTPAGTQVDSTGCNIDKDGDGVLNAQDKCPMTPRGTEVDATGCALKDGDNDGVLDANDSCPNTAPGARVNAKGCALDLDTDNDGVLDSRDKCLNTPSTDKVDADGCSVFEQREVSVGLDILFPNNSSDITNPDDADITEFVDFMKRYPNTQAVIEGHTSAVGNADYNQLLSEKRANAVRDLLVERYGIAANRLEAVGFGETQLKDTDDTAEAHRMNRRIEVNITALLESKVTR